MHFSLVSLRPADSKLAARDSDTRWKRQRVPYMPNLHMLPFAFLWLNVEF